MNLHKPVSHTVALIRRLRQMPLRNRPRRGRIPKQAQPDAIRVRYFRAILPWVARAERFFSEESGEILRLLTNLRREQHKKDHARLDTDGAKRARELIDRAARRTAESFGPHELKAVARKFGKQTTDFQKEQLDRQVRAAIGVSYDSIEKPVRDKVDEFSAVNVDLIKTVNDRYFDRLRLDVQEAFAGGTHPDTLAADFVERYGMAEDDARRIARDQIGKLNAQVNQERQESIGVTGYTWRGMNDQRERDEHLEREGQHFDWDDPPEDGHPGEPVQCRCYSEPDFSPLLEDEGD